MMEETDVARKMKEALFAIIKDGNAPLRDAYYGGVLVETEMGPKLAYLRLSFEEPPKTK